MDIHLNFFSLRFEAIQVLNNAFWHFEKLHFIGKGKMYLVNLFQQVVISQLVVVDQYRYDKVEEMLKNQNRMFFFFRLLLNLEDIAIEKIENYKDKNNQ